MDDLKTNIWKKIYLVIEDVYFLFCIIDLSIIIFFHITACCICHIYICGFIYCPCISSKNDSMLYLYLLYNMLFFLWPLIYDLNKYVNNLNGCVSLYV